MKNFSPLATYVLDLVWSYLSCVSGVLAEHVQMFGDIQVTGGGSVCVCGGGEVEGKKDEGAGRGVEREEGGRERREGCVCGGEIGERDVYVWRKIKPEQK